MKRISENEKREFFYDEDLHYIKLSEKLEYRKIKASDYGCAKKESAYGVQTIYATYGNEQKLSDLTSLCQCNTPKLLMDTLSLISKLQNEFEHPSETSEGKIDYFTFPNKLFDFDRDIPEKAVELIITWCKQYGFPFLRRAEDIKKARSLIPGKEPPNHIDFSVPEFLYELYRLYSAFRLYEVIINNQEFGDNNAAVFIPIKGANKVVPRYRTVRIGEHGKEECQKFFAELYMERQYSCNITFSKGKAYTRIIADSVFDAAYYQLAMLLNDSGTYLKRCPLCHEYFEPAHARQKYCDSPYCTPQRAHKQKLQAVKRKADE